jgi:hypothetical protein
MFPCFLCQHYDLKKLRTWRFGMKQFVSFLFGMQVQVSIWVTFFLTFSPGLFPMLSGGVLINLMTSHAMFMFN